MMAHRFYLRMQRCYILRAPGERCANEETTDREGPKVP